MRKWKNNADGATVLPSFLCFGKVESSSFEKTEKYEKRQRSLYMMRMDEEISKAEFLKM
ncbi:MAG: hypothetical protein ACI35R_12990 [Bacillus sp. (in: firmicutes)]